MARPSDVARLLRPVNGALMGLIVVVGALVASRWRPPPAPALAVGALVGFLLTGSAMVLNDIADLEIDRINDPDRPLPSGRVGVGEAWAIFAALSALGLGLAAANGVPELALAAASYAVAVAYDLRGKRTGLPGNAMVAFTGVSPLLYGGLLAGAVTPALALEALMVFLVMVGREVVKGVADVEGDAARGVETVAVSRGPAFASRLAAALVLSAVALSPLPAALRMADPALYAPFVAAADAVFVHDSLQVLRSPTRRTALEVKNRWLVVAFPVALLGFALGAL